MTSPSPSTVPTRAANLAPAMVALVGVLILSVVLDVLLSTLPARFDEGQWRFQAFGLFLAQGPQLTILLVVLLVIGLVGAHRLAIRAGAIIAIVLAVLFIILVPFFALDFLQQRRLVAVAQRHRYDLAAMKTGAMALVFVPFLLWAASRSWKAGQQSKAEGSRRAKGEGLIVGQEINS